jgi:hypothetical protein
MNSSLWDGFAEAVVRITLDEEASVTLVPAPPGSVGYYPFDGPVHIITAYNPGGDLADEAANQRSHAELVATATAAGWSALPTVGSGRDGSMPEPGLAVLDITLDEAVALGARFGQAAVYAWHPDRLDIVGVSDEQTRSLGWRVEDAPNLFR